MYACIVLIFLFWYLIYVSIFKHFCSEQLGNIDFGEVLSESYLQTTLNIVFGVGLSVSTALFALMVASCVFACGAKGGKVDRIA